MRFRLVEKKKYFYLFIICLRCNRAVRNDRNVTIPVLNRTCLSDHRTFVVIVSRTVSSRKEKKIGEASNTRASRAVSRNTRGFVVVTTTETPQSGLRVRGASPFFLSPPSVGNSVSHYDLTSLSRSPAVETRSVLTESSLDAHSAPYRKSARPLTSYNSFSFSLPIIPFTRSLL